MFRSLIHFLLAVLAVYPFEYGYPVFPSTIIVFFPTVYSWLPWKRSVYYIFVDLVLGSLFCPIGLFFCFYVSTILFWLLWLDHIVWNQEVLCLQFFLKKDSLLREVPQVIESLPSMFEALSSNLSPIPQKIHLVLGGCFVVPYEF
jgi:hypothetical protein